MDTTTNDNALVQVQRDDRGIVRFTLNRPAAFNSLSEALIEALERAIAALAADDGARLLVIAGAGRAFCAGHDLKEMREAPSQAYYDDLFARCGRMMLSLQALPVPVIARVHGIATAAGCQLVAACDMAVAVRAARFAVSGVNLGLFCSAPSVPLSRNVPRKAAFEMLVTGDFIDAERALRLGLVNHVVDDEAALDAEIDRLAASIVAKPRVAIEIGKRLFYRQIERPIAEAAADGAHTMACNMMEPSALEGVQAFIEKRKPAW